MDAPDFAWQVPQSRIENRISVNPIYANRPSNFPSFGTRHNDACNFMYKKEKCRNFWFKGRCDYGVKCTFAHGAEEINNSNSINVPKRKTCWFSWRKCPYGEKCIFLHEPFEQHGGRRDYLCREKSIISIEPIGDNAELQNKTGLCSEGMVLNGGIRGSNYAYAHGQAELQRTTPVPASESENAQIATMVAVKSTSPNEAHKPTAKLAPKVCLFKWKNSKIKKIVSIYADWIDEESPIPCLASEN